MNGASVVPGMRSFRPRQGPQSGQIQHRREFFGSLSLDRERVGGCTRALLKYFSSSPILFSLSLSFATLFALLTVQIRRMPFAGLVNQIA